MRVRWDPETQMLTEDKFQSTKYQIEGQGAGDAPGVVGKWIISNADASPSTTVSICAFALSHDDSNGSSRFCPWDKTRPVRGASMSTSAASFSTEPENRMFFMQD